MKNRVKYLALGIAAFVIGLSINNFAISNPAANFKVAVVDVPKVVGASQQVQNLKAERETKMKELAQFVQKAREDVGKQTDDKKKKELEDKYNKELNAKTEVIQKDYSKKLADIDKSITAVIEQKAKAAKYDLVIAKGVVLFGGTDITAEIQKSVK